MARPLPSRELDALMRIVGMHPEGIGIEQIEALLAHPPNRRTVQRWLGLLVDAHRLSRTGRARGTRYHSKDLMAASPDELRYGSEPVLADHGIALSAEAQAIAAHVRQAMPQRRAVGYQQEFLEAYEPNASYYLPPALRAELLDCGQAVQASEPAGTFARSMAHRLLIDLSWNSSRLEGNTYSLLETERLIGAGAAASGKDALEAQMILNHKEAIEYLVDAADEIAFDRFTVLNLHAMLADRLLQNPAAAGRLRRIAVGISHTSFQPLEGPQRIDACFDLVLQKAAAIRDPFEQAFFALVHLPYLQPFEDVNKRVSRLAANIPLIKGNLCPLSFVDVPRDIYISALLGVYELRRVDLLREVFTWAYRRSCGRYATVRQTLREPDPVHVKYRLYVIEAIARVVRERMDMGEAVSCIQRLADDHVAVPDRPRFIEIVETELIGLHEGSIARFRLRPAEFRDWRAVWH